ncbi:MAG: sigma factor [Acidimicrobiia bacterium]
MSGVPILEELRPRAFAVAYRMLGSVSEAEDIVQEALLRLHLTLQQGERIESPGAYLSTMVTRLCIDQLRSARVRRESYVGEWLPEPLVDDGRSDPADHAELADSLSLAFLVLLTDHPPRLGGHSIRHFWDGCLKGRTPRQRPMSRSRTTPCCAMRSRRPSARRPDDLR